MKDKLTSFLKRLQHRFRLVLFDETTLAEVSHLRLSRLNLYGWLSALVLCLLLCLFALIIFTPIKQYVPGYGNFNNYRRAMSLLRTTDSLRAVTEAQYEYIAHLRTIFADTLDMPIPTEAMSPITEWADSGANTEVVPIWDTLSRAELDLRNAIEQEGKEALYFEEQAAYESGIADLYFFAPATGVVLQNYRPEKAQFGIDIVGTEGSAIKAISDGVVLMTDYSPSNGYTVVIQHAHNLVSIYKHNLAVLKKESTFVRTGEVIAQMGGSLGVNDTSAYVHFELWYRQNPVNPTDYILLNY